LIDSSAAFDWNLATDGSLFSYRCFLKKTCRAAPDLLLANLAGAGFLMALKCTTLPNGTWPAVIE